MAFLEDTLRHHIERNKKFLEEAQKEERMNKDKKYNVEFPVCGHPELIPTMWGYKKPEACQTVGRCPLHNYICPICGFGVGSGPGECNCPEMRD